MELDHFVKRERLEPFTIEVKSGADLYDRRAKTEADKVDYALSQFLVSRIHEKYLRFCGTLVSGMD